MTSCKIQQQDSAVYACNAFSAVLSIAGLPNAMFVERIFRSLTNGLGTVTAFPILFVSDLPHSLPRNHVSAGGFVFFHLPSAQG